MGFFEQGAMVREMPVTVLLAGFQAKGMLPVFGMLQTYINDDTKSVFTIRNATLHGLEPGNPAVSMHLPELYVRKDQCHAVAFTETLSHDETGLMPRAERLAVYTSHFVIQGHYHMGADEMLSDFIDSAKSLFIGATDAFIFPLFKPQAAVIQQSPLVFIYRDVTRMHHPM
ncbi:MAG: hypothetical protein JW966_05750 [Anaerolineae bacterium]|nr:hypothetical protein [Anaerolineae bacterium]